MAQHRSPAIILNARISPGLGINNKVSIASGSPIYLKSGSENEYTQLVIQNKWIAIEYLVNNEREKVIQLWDGSLN